MSDTDTEDIQEHLLFTMRPVGKQTEFHQSPAESRWIIAGNQSGKSTAGAREAAWHATGLHPYRDVAEPSIGWIITIDRTFVNEVLLPTLLPLLPPSSVLRVVKGDVVHIEMQNGSKIVFRTYGQGWQKFQGARIDWAWFDEECPEAVYDEVMVRLIAKQGNHWVTMTPLQGKTWVHKRIFSKRKSFPQSLLQIFQWKTTENTSLNEERVRRVFGGMNPNIRNARMNGDFVSLEGLIWPQLDESIHVVDPFELQPHWPLITGMDYGFRHPFAAINMAVDETGRIVVWKVYAQAEQLMVHHARAILRMYMEHAPHAVDTGAAERIFKAIEERKIPSERAAIRAQFRLDASAQGTRRELLPYGISADNADRDIDTRLERVGALLTDTLEGRPGIVFMRGRCGPLLDEMRGYSWKKKQPGDETGGKDEPQDFDDDCCDGLGYGVIHAPTRAQARETEPPEMSPEWLRQMRGRAVKTSQRMGNEHMPPELIHTRMLRLGKRW
jgi:phage terminase large subunit-like protein